MSSLAWAVIMVHVSTALALRLTRVVAGDLAA
jgi:hypothetical protein